MDNFFKDIINCFPNFYPEVVFDVGANVGEFTKTSIRFFPKSQYFCFEPSSDTFNKLSKNISLPNVSLNKIALTDRDAELKFTKSHSLCNSLVIEKETDKYNRQLDKLDLRMRVLSGEDIETETVIAKTFDNFCKDGSIDHVNLLKIDTEGFDFEVLRGAESMLSKQKIDIIYTELTFAKDINKFSRVFDVINFLWEYDYEVFRFYDQASVDGKLRRANIVLTSAPLRQYNVNNIWK